MKKKKSFLSTVGSAIKESWNSMSKSDKFKICIRMLCAIGSGSVFGVLAGKYIEEENPGLIEGTAVVTAAVGAAWYTADKAYGAWEKQIDNFEQLRSLYNGSKTAEALGEEPETKEVVG